VRRSILPTLSDGNRGVFESRAVADEYESLTRSLGLFEPEKVILGRLLGELAGGTLLDVGVGAGRTTPALSAACRRYFGIDYAQAMIDRCRGLFPNLDFRRHDARDLSAFEPQSFDAVWFSYNGIDYVPPEDRGRVLRECSRVLRPGGALVFSSHNLHAPAHPPTLFPEWRQEGHPLRRQISNLRRLFRHVGHHVNYRARKAHERSGDGHALLVDMAHGYRLMTCFVTPEFQDKQLRETGFDGVEIFAQDGSALAAGSRSSDPWLYYFARKLAGRISRSRLADCMNALVFLVTEEPISVLSQCLCL
jgi:SAM-dependent methyltransferase